MKIWINPFLLANENVKFGINTNILETNLINILLLVGLLVYVLGNFLSNNLLTRQTKIIEGVENSEKRLNDATNRVKEAKLQWEQASLSLKEIQRAAEAKKMSIFENQCEQAKKELMQRFTDAFSNLHFREKKIFDSVVRDATILTLYQVKSKLENKLGEAEQTLLIDKKINQLESS